MPRIRRVLGLAELPTPSTLCKAFNRLDMAVWRVILTLSATLLPTSGIVGVDASGFDRSHASKHYTKRAEFTIQQLKMTLLVDAKVNTILDLHATTTRKHEVRPLIKHREFTSLHRAWNARLDADLYGQRSQPAGAIQNVRDAQPSEYRPNSPQRAGSESSSLSVASHSDQ